MCIPGVNTHAQVVGIINNEGAAVTVENAAVDAKTIENTLDSITNHGEINLTRDYINIGTTSGNGRYNLGGDWRNTGVFTPGTSTVQFWGDSIQNIVRVGGESFHNLIINNTGSPSLFRNLVQLPNNVTVSNSLTFHNGNFVTGTNKLYLENLAASSLIYLSTTRSRVIGKLERGVGETNNYLFPIGSILSPRFYNPLNLKPNVITNSGSLLAEFFKTVTIDTLGLPLLDDFDSVEVYQPYHDGYWSLTPDLGFQSMDYNINMKGSGFSDSIHDISSVIRRDGILDPWQIDGTHQDANEVDSVGYRNNLDDGFDGDGNGNHFAFGHTRPRIMEQPMDTSVCDQTPAWFEVRARWRKRVSYHWQVSDDNGVSWSYILEGAPYTGTRSDRLIIDPADIATMDQNLYRVVVTHKHGHYNISEPGRLTVNPIPTAFASVNSQILCNNTISYVEMTSDVPLTTFVLDTIETNSITGWTFVLSGGTILDHTLNNPGTEVDSIIYRIIPFGPVTTYCEGYADTVVIYVNPTPRLFAHKLPSDPMDPEDPTESLYCNDTEVFFEVSNTVGTTGTILYDLDVTDPGNDFSGESTDAIDLYPVTDNFSDTLSHTNGLIDTISYNFEPYIYNANAYLNPHCRAGIDTTVIVKMVPELIADTIPNRWIGNHNIRCNGLYDGLVYLNAIGGDYRGEFTYRWEDEVRDSLQEITHVNDSIKGLGAGEYFYSITDRIGCYLLDSITLTEPDTLIGDETIKAPLCFNSSTGDIEMVVSGGIEDYDYEWILLRQGPPPISYDLNLYGVQSGGYKFTVVDTNECVYTEVYTIEDAVALKTDLSRISEPRDGRWNLECFGDSDAYAEVLTVDGTATHPVAYTWYDSEASMVPIAADSLIENISAGVYYAEARDANNCLDPEGRFEVTINEPDPITVSKVNTPYGGGWDISCFGRSDGIIDLEYLGGAVDTLKNTFDWAGPGIVTAGDSIQNSLTAGAYTLNIEDYLGCTLDTSFVLIEPPEINYWLDTSKFVGDWNVSCYGRTDGWIKLDSIRGGGTTTEGGRYTYNWTALDPPPGFSFSDPTDSSQSDLPAGEYQLEVEDQIGCPRDTIITLTEPDILKADTLIDRAADKNGFAIRCFGDSDGEISLVPEGGTRSYSYVWYDSTRQVPILGDTIQEDLYEGIYRVTISDANTCDTTYIFDLNQPDTIMLNPMPGTPGARGFIECFGETDTIFVDPSGGNTQVTEAYQFDWDYENRTDTMLANVVAGTYYVRVTDDNNCYIDDSVTLEESSQITPTIQITSTSLYNERDISCYGFSDGIVDVAVEGGHEDEVYTFLWNNGEETTLIQNLDSGYYAVTITDLFSCSVIADTTLIYPPLLELEVQFVDPLCQGVPTGEINLIPTGGTPYPITPSYTFNWSNAAYTGDQLTDLPEGDYTVSIIDANNCLVDTTISLIEPQALELEYDTVRAECADESDGSITITYTDGGTAPYLTSIGDLYSDYFPDLPAGDYVIVMEDAYGCIRIDTATVKYEQYSCIAVPNAFTPNGDGSNDTWVLDEDEDGSTDMIFYPEAELRIYNRWGVLIYYTNNVAYEPWDGTYKGRDMPIDSYHYILDLNNGDPAITGNVTIIR